MLAIIYQKIYCPLIVKPLRLDRIYGNVVCVRLVLSASCEGKQQTSDHWFVWSLISRLNENNCLIWRHYRSIELNDESYVTLWPCLIRKGRPPPTELLLLSSCLTSIGNVLVVKIVNFIVLERRFNSNLDLLMFLLWSPIGLCLFIIRTFIGLHALLVASLLPKRSSIRWYISMSLQFDQKFILFQFHFANNVRHFGCCCQRRGLVNREQVKDKSYCQQSHNKHRSHGRRSGPTLHCSRSLGSAQSAQLGSWFSRLRRQTGQRCAHRERQNAFELNRQSHSNIMLPGRRHH